MKARIDRLALLLKTAPRKRLLALAGLFLIVLALPLSVFVSQQQQNLKQQAATPGSACSPIGTEVCVGNSAQTCASSGVWGQLGACPSGTTCTAVADKSPGVHNVSCLANPGPTTQPTAPPGGGTPAPTTPPVVTPNPTVAPGDICVPSSERCNGNIPQTCNSTGTAWSGTTACSGTTLCQKDYGYNGVNSTPQVSCLATCTSGAERCIKINGETFSRPQTCAASGIWGAPGICSTGTCQTDTANSTTSVPKVACLGAATPPSSGSKWAWNATTKTCVQSATGPYATQAQCESLNSSTTKSYCTSSGQCAVCSGTSCPSGSNAVSGPNCTGLSCGGSGGTGATPTPIPVPPGSQGINFNVFNDNNVNGVKDSGESAASGISVIIWGDLTGCQFATCGTGTLGTATTNTSGTATWTDSSSTSRRVGWRIQPPKGYTFSPKASNPAGQTVLGTEPPANSTSVNVGLVTPPREVPVGASGASTNTINIKVLWNGAPVPMFGFDLYNQNSPAGHNRFVTSADGTVKVTGIPDSQVSLTQINPSGSTLATGFTSMSVNGVPGGSLHIFSDYVFKSGAAPTNPSNITSFGTNAFWNGIVGQLGTDPRVFVDTSKGRTLDLVFNLNTNIVPPTKFCDPNSGVISQTSGCGQPEQWAVFSYPGGGGICQPFWGNALWETCSNLGNPQGNTGAWTTGTDPNPGGNPTPTPAACSSTTCPNGTCVNNTCIGSGGPPPVNCTNGAFQCSSNNVQICVNNQFVPYLACTTNQTCNATAGRCDNNNTGQCANGDFQCVGQNLQVCSLGSWTNSRTCSTGQICNAATRTCDNTGGGNQCANGDFQCVGQNLQVCTNNNWVNSRTCSVGQTCNAATRTCENNTTQCTNGEFQCAGKVLQVCNNGAWGNSQTCSTTQTCNATTHTCDNNGGGTGPTSLSFVVGLDGIGTTGDHQNPNGGGNTSPQTTTRPAVVQVYDVNNSLVDTQNTNLTYQPSTGKFTATVSLKQGFTSGSYRVFIKASRYLRRNVGGIQTITAGNTNPMPAASLTTGDIVGSAGSTLGDNAITILDYNVFISCSIFSKDNGAACNQNSSYRTQSDLTDNGIVDMDDYTLLLREWVVQSGD